MAVVSIHIHENPWIHGLVIRDGYLDLVLYLPLFWVYPGNLTSSCIRELLTVPRPIWPHLANRGTTNEGVVGWDVNFSVAFS